MELLFPGVNDSEEEMSGIADLINNLKNVELAELLPFHSMARTKYESLGMQYGAEGIEPPSAPALVQLIRIFEKRKLKIMLNSIINSNVC